MRKEPYLETHHVVWLAKGGEDTIEHTVAICPNCHRKMHSLNLKTDTDFLIRKLEEYEAEVNANVIDCLAIQPKKSASYMTPQ